MSRVNQCCTWWRNRLSAAIATQAMDGVLFFLNEQKEGKEEEEAAAAVCSSFRTSNNFFCGNFTLTTEWQLNKMDDHRWSVGRSVGQCPMKRLSTSSSDFSWSCHSHSTLSFAQYFNSTNSPRPHRPTHHSSSSREMRQLHTTLGCLFVRSSLRRRQPL